MMKHLSTKANCFIDHYTKISFIQIVYRDKYIHLLFKYAYIHQKTFIVAFSSQDSGQFYV